MNGTKSPRRRSYGSSLRSADYFMVHHLGRFIRGQIAARLRPEMTVLDVGCGEQPLRALVEVGGGRYVSADVVQNARGTVDHLCPITALPIAAGAVDLILCTEVMEHVPETQPALCELARVLRPGGWIILTTSLLYPLHEEPHDFVRLTPFQIERCAAEAGLEVVEMERAGNEFEVLASFYGRCWVWVFDLVTQKTAQRWCAIGIGLLQGIVNGLAHLAGRLLPLERRRRVFLNTMCVLRKIGTATG